MSAIATDQEYRCSCGRTFAHEISLKRHRWVTGHAEGQVVAAAPAARIAVAVAAPVVAAAPSADDTYREAVALLIQKRFEYESQVDRQRKAAVRKAFVRDFLLFLQEGLQSLGQAAQKGGRSTASAFSSVADMTLKLAFILAFSLGLIFAGMGVGRVIATQAEAQTSSSVAAVSMADAGR